MPRRWPPSILVLVATLACGDSTGAPAPVSHYRFDITGAAGTVTIKGDSAVWTTTGRGLFNGQFVALTPKPPLPSPLLVVIFDQDGTLPAGAPVPPGTYTLDPSDPAIPSLGLNGPQLSAFSDSGTITVVTPRADSLFEGTVDVWLSDTTASAITYHVTGHYSAVPFH